MPSGLQHLLSELRRRRVYRAAMAYAAAAFVVLQVADLVLPALRIGPLWYRRLVLLVLIGFPVTVVLSWMFEWTGRGLRREGIDLGGDGGPAGAGTGAGALVPARLSTQRFSLTVVALAVVGGGLWWLRPSLTTAKVTVGADVVAVLPFRASGAGEELGEGMVDLLSRNLDEMGPIRTLDPVRVLRAVEAQGSRIDQETARRIGSHIGAGSVLLGSAVRAGTDLRLDAELVAVEGGSLAQVRVEGPADRALALVDSLTMSLVRRIWIAREPVPTARLSAVTTGSPEALRAYLAGEGHYRASRWDSAAAHLERAVEIDPGFALAWLRLSTTYGWSEQHRSPRSVEAAERAWRFAERLPQRERAIGAAARLWRAEGRAEPALDSLRSVVERYPDDVQAWSLLADIQYHARGALGLSDREVLAAFERVNELDPLLAPALIHPLDMTFARDSAEAQPWFERYERAVGPEAADIYRGARAALKGHGDLDRAVRALIPRRAALAADLVRTALVTGRHAGREVTEAILALRTATDPDGREGWLSNGALFLGALGRMERAEAMLDSLQEIAPESALNLRASSVLTGLAPALHPTLAGGFSDAPAPWNRALPPLLQAVDALNRGAPEDAAEPLVRLAAIPDPDGGGVAAMADVIQGLSLVARGDTAEGLELAGSALVELEDADQVARSNRVFFEARRLMARAAWSDAPASAITDLENATFGHPHLEVLRHEALARSYQVHGDTAAAVASWEAILRLWDEAAPHLRNRVQAARRAMVGSGARASDTSP